MGKFDIRRCIHGVLRIESFYLLRLGEGATDPEA